MKQKMIIISIVIGLFCIFYTGCSLFNEEHNKPVNNSEVCCNISDVIKEIPYDIKGISSIEQKNSSWVIKTVNVSDDIANQAVHPTYKFVCDQYIFNSKNGKIEKIGKSTYSNEEYLPPSFTSLSGAVESVKKTAKDSVIFSVKFYNGSWAIEVIPIHKAETQIIRYTINPVNSVITKTEILH